MSAGNGGGIYGNVTLLNTIVAGNTDNSTGTKHPDCSGTITSRGYNLIQSTTGCTITGIMTGNITGVSANLGALANNGGPTLTHLPNTGSPVIDAGTNVGCAGNDQRGYNRPAEGNADGNARCDIGAVEVGGQPATTITYTYDKLYRLTNASYNSGRFFTYAYDAVGNRLSELTQAGTITYTYDNANRLTNAGGIAYTWDANGNLLADGVYTYTYDMANRLATLRLGNTVYTYTYGYNGVGDRLRQVTNGVTTTYTLDLASGLTQVLADGTNTYFYGNGRISQQNATLTEFFLSNAIGSVRQTADITGTVTVAKGYQPFGSVLNNTGHGTSNYGFTGEWMDDSGLINLRARYYACGRAASSPPPLHYACGR